MYSSLGYVFALSWGIGAGVVTSIPLGPTGALVLSSAKRDDRKGVLYAVLGLASAQIVFQSIYHLGFSRVLIENTRAITLIGSCGIVMTLFFGLQHLWRAGKMVCSQGVTLQVFDIKNLNQFNGNGKGLFVRALTAGLFNPFLLIYIVANVSMFVSIFPDYSTRGYLVVLLLGGLLGTMIWYLFFGEMIRRHSLSWGRRGHFAAELSSGLLMFIAGSVLFWKLAV